MPKKFEAEVIGTLKEIERRMEFLEVEMVTIKNWLSDDDRLTPYETKLVEEAVKKVRSGRINLMPTLEEIRRRAGV
jgi:hypothetical protein